MRWIGVVVAVIAAAVDILYIGLVDSQGGGDPEYLRIPFVAAFIALMAICAALSARRSSITVRAALLGVSAGGLLLLGFFAIFSIGLPLLLAGVLALLGVILTLSHAGGAAPQIGRAPLGAMAAGGALVAVVILLAGFSLAEQAIRCPSTGTMSGGGPGLLGGSYQYSCDNGRLTISR